MDYREKRETRANSLQSASYGTLLISIIMRLRRIRGGRLCALCDHLFKLFILVPAMPG
jgi:hypothetical protein